MIALLLWLAQPAAAHPQSMRIVSHRLWVVVGDRIHVDYYAELPIGDPTGHDGSPEHRFDIESFATLATGLLVQVDGVTVPLEPIPGFEPDLRANGARVGCRIVLDAPFPDGRVHQLRVSNGNYPDLDGYFSTALDVTTAFEVTESSLVERDGWRIVRDWNGGWGVGDRHREVTATLRRLDGVAWGATRLVTGTQGVLRSSADASPRPLWVQWMLRGWSPAVVAVLLCAVAAVGAAAGAARTRSAVAIGVVGTLALLGVGAPGLAMFGAIVGAAAAVAGWRLGPERPIERAIPLAVAVAALLLAGARLFGRDLLY